MTAPILPGADAWSHEGDGDHGVVVLHGFTGNPSSMRGVAEAFAGQGYHVELPRLPGHGTLVEEMLPTRWADWAGEAENAHRRLRQRADRVVVVGLSMGGALTLRLGADHPDIAGLVCINPVTMPQTDVVIEMLRGLVDGGTAVLPGIGSDIADPDAKENAYAGTPVEPLLSMLVDGIEPLSKEYGGMRMPLLLLNSPQDHVVEPAHAEFLAAHYGGPIDRLSLERSYHVATQDYDKELVIESALAFAARLLTPA